MDVKPSLLNNRKQLLGIDFAVLKEATLPFPELTLMRVTIPIRL